MVSLCACGEEHAGVTAALAAEAHPCTVKQCVAVMIGMQVLHNMICAKLRDLPQVLCSTGLAPLRTVVLDLLSVLGVSNRLHAHVGVWHPQINITGYWDLYNRVLSDRTTLQKAGAMPSSGLLGTEQSPSSSKAMQSVSAQLKCKPSTSHGICTA